MAERGGREGRGGRDDRRRRDERARRDDRGREERGRREEGRESRGKWRGPAGPRPRPPVRGWRDRPREDAGPYGAGEGRPRERGDRPREAGDRPYEGGDRARERGPWERRDRQERPWRDRGGEPWRERAGEPWRRDTGRRPGPGREDRQGRPAAPRTAPPEDLLQADEELVAGRRPVEEAFAARREARRLLVVPERRAALDALVLHATAMRIPVVEVEGGTLTSLTGFDGHQGVAVAVAARRPATIEDVLVRARERSEPPFVLVLDSLEDPQNLGTLLRSAEACGVHGVIFPTRRSAPLSPSAIKASAGATEHLLLLPVDDLAATLADLRSRGLRLVGADEGAALRYGEADLRGPLGLVVGSEERGISGALRRRLDLLVRIPMRGRVASLNAAVAGSVLLFAAGEQRGANDDEAMPAAAGDQAQPTAAPAADAGEQSPTRPSRSRSRARRADVQPTSEEPEPAGTVDEELLPGEQRSDEAE